MVPSKYVKQERKKLAQELQRELEQYLNEIIKNPSFSKLLIVKIFFAEGLKEEEEDSPSTFNSTPSRKERYQSDDDDEITIDPFNASKK